MKYLILIALSTLSLQAYAAQQAASGKVEGVTVSVTTDFRAFKLTGVAPPCDTQYRWIKIAGTEQQRSEIWSILLSAQATKSDIEIRYDDTSCELNTIFLWQVCLAMPCIVCSLMMTRATEYLIILYCSNNQTNRTPKATLNFVRIPLRYIVAQKPTTL